MKTKFKLAGFLVTLIISCAVFIPLVMAGANWSSPVRVTDNDVEDGDLSLAVRDGRAYIVFARGEGTEREVYLRTNVSGNWESERLTHNSTADWAPDIAIDESGKIHVAYLFGDPTSGGDSELAYKTNKSGPWLTELLTNTNEWEKNPSIATHNGLAHIVYGRNMSPRDEIWYATNVSGSWQQTRVSDNGYAVEGGSITQHNGVPHIAYTNQMTDRSGNPDNRSTGTLDDEIHYGNNEAGSWNISRVTFNSTSDAAPDIAVDKNGKVHIAYRGGDTQAGGGDYEIHYTTNKSGPWNDQVLTDDANDDNFPSIAVDGSKLFVAWQKWDSGIWSSGDTEIYFRQKSLNGEHWRPAQQLTNNSVNDLMPAVAAYKGEAHIAFMEESPDGDIIYMKQRNLAVEATIDIKPETLNLQSKGNWVTAYIELADYDVTDIILGTVMLEGTIPAETGPTEVGDYDDDGIDDLMVKFNRQALIEYLDGTTGEVTLAVSGVLNGVFLTGDDTISAINP